MNFDQMGILAHFAPVVAMLLIVMLNRRALHRQHTNKAAVDGLRLRAALRSELQFLLEVYRRNLSVLRGNDGILLSGRPLTAVFRTNSARLIVLSEEEIPAIVAAYGFSEAVEGLVAATMRSGPGHAHRLKATDLPLQEIERQVALGCERIAAAIAAMDRCAPSLQGDAVEPVGGVTMPATGLDLLRRSLPIGPVGVAKAEGRSALRAVGFGGRQHEGSTAEDEEEAPNLR
jgi:hypothetical protein